MGRGGQGNYSRYGAPIDTSIPNSRAKNGVFNTLLDFGIGAITTPGGALNHIIGGLSGVRSGRGVRNQLAREYALQAAERQALGATARDMGIDDPLAMYGTLDQLKARNERHQRMNANDMWHQLANGGTVSVQGDMDPAQAQAATGKYLDQLSGVSRTNYLLNGGGRGLYQQGQDASARPYTPVGNEVVTGQYGGGPQVGAYQQQAGMGNQAPYEYTPQGNIFAQPNIDPSTIMSGLNQGASNMQEAYKMTETQRNNLRNNQLTDKGIDARMSIAQQQNKLGYDQLDERRQYHQDQVGVLNDVKKASATQVSAQRNQTAALKKADANGFLRDNGSLKSFNSSWTPEQKKAYREIKNQLNLADQQMNSANQVINTGRMLTSPGDQLTAPDLQQLKQQYEVDYWQ